jgi:hypothetical protein
MPHFSEGCTMRRSLRLGVAVLLACSAGWASARTSVAVDLNFGFPLYGASYGALPVGAVGVGVYGGSRYWYHGGLWYRPWGPRWVVVAPPVGVAVPVYYPATVVDAPPPVSVAPTRPDPIIYPRHGQDAQRTELDRQQCNRWATTQPAAVADASTFQRAVEACMDGRGYTMK